MSVYHKKTGRISHIELKEAGKPCISKAYTIQNDIYMVPANSETPFLIFHTESNRYEIRKDFWTNIFTILTNSQKIFLDLYSSCMVYKELYSCGQRAKRACLHAHLATAAGVNTPQLCCVASLMPRQLAAGLLTLAINHNTKKRGKQDI